MKRRCSRLTSILMLQNQLCPQSCGPATSYTIVYVTPLLSVRCPPPPGSQARMYAAAFPPPFPLHVGDVVHLHLLCTPIEELESTTRTWAHPVTVPLGIEGTISGERERSELEVEFVIRCDKTEARVPSVFLRMGAEPRDADAPTSSDCDFPLRRPDRDEELVRAVRGVCQERVARAGPVARTDLKQTGSTEPSGMLEMDRSAWAPRPPEHYGADRRTARGARTRKGGGGRVGAGTPLQRLEKGVGSESTEQEAEQWREVPGPTQRIFPPWLVPSKRSRREREAGVGEKPSRSTEAPTRAPGDLCQH